MRFTSDGDGGKQERRPSLVRQFANRMSSITHSHRCVLLMSSGARCPSTATGAVDARNAAQSGLLAFAALTIVRPGYELR